MLSHPGRALEDFFRRLVAQNDYAAVIGEIALIKVAPIREIQFAHLPVRHIHAAHLDRNDASTDLEPEVAVDLAAHGAHDRNFVANRFHIFQFVR